MAAILGILSLLSIGTLSIVGTAIDVNPLELITFSSYLGGTGDEHMDVSYAFGSTAVDSHGNIIVVGQTTSTDFPLKDAYQGTISGNSDGTISKFYPNGSLMFSTYLGGLDQEVITEVVIDSDDNIIVAGVTGSSDFPVVNAYKSNSTGVAPGTVDSFITKFSEDGQTILYSTFFGGTGNDWLYTMNIDSSGRIAISGTTDSTDMPVLNAHQETNAGLLDIYVALFATDGQSLLFSTYIGTPGIDHGRRIVFDSNGDIVVAGMCGVGDIATEGVFQEVHSGGSADGFLAKFSVTGSLEYLTYLGGASTDWATDLAIDSDDNIVITGFTNSIDFPLLNPLQEERSGFADQFITKFSSDGDLLFSSFLGGSSPDYGNAITIDSEDRIVVVGQTQSVDFPSNNSLSDSSHDNVTLVVLNSDGTLLISIVLGGEGTDVGIGVAWYSDDSYIIAGYTESDDFPISGAYQDTYAGASDMFLMKIDLAGLIDITTIPTTTLTNGYQFGIVEGGIILGVVAIVILFVVIKKR